jgi:acyl-CoA thioester hydrolase
MDDFFLPLQIRWSDLDPNFHIRHSVYYDWGALCRIEFLNKYGLDAHAMGQLNFGPILFREECIFRKEIRSVDEISISLQLTRSRKDFSRWSIRHEIKKSDGTVCALLSVDGAWMDTIRRRLASPPEKVHDVFGRMPKGEEFEWQ